MDSLAEERWQRRESVNLRPEWELTLPEERENGLKKRASEMWTNLCVIRLSNKEERLKNYSKETMAGVSSNLVKDINL